MSLGRTALLVMHMQPPITDMIGDEALFGRIAGTISAARRHGIPVMYANLGYRPGYPEVALDDPVRISLAPSNMLIDNISNHVLEKLRPWDGDIVFRGNGGSAFSGTDLAIVLQVKDINHLVLAGISTSGVIFGTLSEADDRKFRVTVLGDGCADANPELHRLLLEVFVKPPRRARVVTCDAWVAEIGAAD